jgi:hypothetical protein
MFQGQGYVKYISETLRTSFKENIQLHDTRTRLKMKFKDKTKGYVLRLSLTIMFKYEIQRYILWITCNEKFQRHILILLITVIVKIMI